MRFRAAATAPALLAFWLAAWLAPGPVSAEPYLAVRSGFTCVACHVNRTGGGKRTEFGLIYAQTTLPHLLKAAPGERSVFDPNLNENVSLGGDFRFVNETTVRKDAKDSNGFAITEGNVYLQVDAVPELLTFYLDEKVAPSGASSREAVVLLQEAAHDLYLKAGRMLLPYGLRLWDDDAFIRRVTGFNYDAQDLGVEVGWQPGPWDVSVAVSNGTQGGDENNRDKQLSAVASAVFRRVRVGGSFARNESGDFRRTMGGAFAGFNTGRFTLLGELDILDEEDLRAGATDFGHQRLAYVEADILLAKGINAKLAYDWWDPFTEVEEDERIMLRAGLEPFVTQFLQVRTFFRYREAPAQLELDNEGEVLIELHAFF
jgi:hypothetical protein